MQISRLYDIYGLMLDLKPTIKRVPIVRSILAEVFNLRI